MSETDRDTSSLGTEEGRDRHIAATTASREREIVRDWIDNGGAWLPQVVQEAEQTLDAVVQRLVDLGLTEDEIREWFSESLINAHA